MKIKEFTEFLKSYKLNLCYDYKAVAYVRNSFGKDLAVITMDKRFRYALFPEFHRLEDEKLKELLYAGITQLAFTKPEER